MARVQWARGRFKDVAHAIIDGDLVVLCGSGMVESYPAILHSPETIRAMACMDCKAIIIEAAEALVVGSQAGAWDEGYAAGVADYRLGKWYPTDKGAETWPDRKKLVPNPYREAGNG